MVPWSPVPVRCERVSSTTTRGDAPAEPLEGAADAALDVVEEASGEAGGEAGAVEAGAVEAGGALLDVPAGDVFAETAGEDTGVDVLACLDPELQAVASVASATRAATRRCRRDDVSMGLLCVG
jgi:hypothetical protein